MESRFRSTLLFICVYGLMARRFNKEMGVRFSLYVLTVIVW
nr:MAG TPA: hypothetical protein [Caudoviricetes sp.]